MNRTSLCLFLCLMCLMPWKGGKAEPSRGGKGALSLPSEGTYQWQKSCNTNGLTIYWSKVEGSQIIAFKGEGIVDAPLEKVASIIIDTTRGTEWIDSLVESKVTRPISSTEFIEYDHVGVSFPFDALMHDRDFVSHVTVQADPKTRRMTVHYAPTEDPSAPALKKYVRGTMVCEFRLVPMSIPEETYVEAEIHCDPMGSVPKWIVNWFQEGWPQTTFENLRRQAKKSDIQVLPVVEDLLHKPSVKLAKGGR
jgi:hypothetical protein